MEKKVTRDELFRNMADNLGAVIYDQTPVIITRYGKDAAVIISLKDYDKLKKLKEISE